MDFWNFEYLNIPMNDNGVFELDNIYDGKWENVFSIQLTKQDIENTTGLINDFNSAFNIIIDVAEEERLLNKDLRTALEIANKRFITSSDKAKPSIQKIINAIKKAIEYNTFVEFDL
jgi:hypothetical protein